MNNDQFILCIVLYIISIRNVIVIWHFVKTGYLNRSYRKQPKFTLWVSVIYVLILLIPIFGFFFPS